MRSHRYRFKRFKSKTNYPQCNAILNPYKHLIYFLQTKERDTSDNEILKTIKHGNATGVERLPALPSATQKAFTACHTHLYYVRL